MGFWWFGVYGLLRCCGECLVLVVVSCLCVVLAGAGLFGCCVWVKVCLGVVAGFVTI